MSSRNLFGMFLLLTLAVITWFVVQGRREEAAVYDPQEQGPDYWVRDLDTTEMDDRGNPRYSLQAEQMVHFDDDDSTILTAPRFTVFDPDKPPWRINSAKGRVSDDKKLVLLTGNVTINREGRGRLRPIRAVTSRLRIRPQENYAETDRHVKVHSRNDWLESEGAEIWFKAPVRMKFLSKVKAYYENR